MDLIQITLLALIQGLTEFLPISSSAHLILAPLLMGWQDQQLAFDVAVHVGTLSAVVLYFRLELVKMAREWVGSLMGKGATPDSRLAWAVIIATLPAGVAGLLLKDVVEGVLRDPLVIAWATIAFGIALWLGDRLGRRERDEHSLGLKDILIIGFAQALALIPGTSRSGVTMTAALGLGLERKAAARFSFLLSIPLILAAGALETVDLIRQPQQTDWAVLIQGAVLSGVSAYACIHFFLSLLERIGMTPFVIYRLALGGVLLVLFW